MDDVCDVCLNDVSLTHTHVLWQRLWVPTPSLPFPWQHARLELLRRSVAFGQASVVVSLRTEQSVILQNKYVSEQSVSLLCVVFDSHGKVKSSNES